MTGLVHASNTYPPLSDVDLIDAAGLLYKPPIRGQRLIQELQEHRSVNAVVPYENDCVLGMMLDDETQCVCTACNQFLE
jgi:hypothetical protein